MSERGSEDVVGEAVDAVTLGQDEEWERCARLATPAERCALDRLRRFTRLFPALDATGRGAATAPVPARASCFPRRAVRFLMALAAIEVGVTLALLPWYWPAYRQVHGDVAAFLAFLVAGHAASAVRLLLWAGLRDRRTLAARRLLPLQGHGSAGAHAPRLLGAHAAGRGVAGIGLGDTRADRGRPAAVRVSPGEYPRIHRRTRLEDLARRMVSVSAALGGALCAAVAALLLGRAVSDAVDARRSRPSRSVSPRHSKRCTGPAFSTATSSRATAASRPTAYRS